MSGDEMMEDVEELFDGEDDCCVTQIHKQVNDRPDSIEIGTPAKGGALKIYFNADNTQAQTEQRILNAFAARKFAQEKYKEQQEAEK